MNFIAFFKVKYIISMTVILIKTRIKNKRNKIFLLLNKSQGLKKSYYLCMQVYTVQCIPLHTYKSCKYANLSIYYFAQYRVTFMEQNNIKSNVRPEINTN